MHYSLLDTLMGLAIMLFVISGTIGLIWFALKGVELLVDWWILYSAKLELDLSFQAMQKSKTLKNIARYGAASTRYYEAKYKTKLS